MESMNSLLLKYKELAKVTEKTLVDVVEGEGGVIDTSNTSNDTIWAFVYDDSREGYVECMVHKIKAENGHLYIQVSLRPNEEPTEDDWYSIFGGYVQYNATLPNICESIWQHILKYL